MTTRYEQIKAALLDRYAAAMGDAFTAYLGYEPLVIQDTPLLYVLYERDERRYHGNVLEVNYYYWLTALYQWQDVEQAELELDPHVDALQAVIYQDVTLGGVVTRGNAWPASARGAFLTWQRGGAGGVTYRAIQISIRVLDKTPWDFVRGVPA